MRNVVTAVYENIRITRLMSVRQTGHPAARSQTGRAHALQKRACPHGVSAKPSRGATRHTSHQSSAAAAAAADTHSDAADVVAAGTGA